MLRITLHDSPRASTFKLEGKLTGPWVCELEQCWQTAQSALHGRPVIVDLAQVDFVDAAGKALLARMREGGAELVARSPLTKAIVEQICGAGKALTVLAVAAVALGAGLRAQGAAPLRLTLREAVQMALRQNPQAQAAVLNLAQSQEQAAIARADLLPQASLQSFERDQRFNLQAFIGGQFPGLPQHAGPFAVFQAAGMFSAPVLDLTAYRRWQASRHLIGASSAESDVVREQVTSLVVSQGLGALRASADVRAAQSRVDLAQALYNQAADLQRAGVGTGIDSLRANVQLQAEKQRLLVARVQEQTALYGLARLLNLDARQSVELTEAMSFFATPPVSPAQTLDAALANRPELRALRFQAQALEARKRAARAARYPNLRADGFWGYQGLTSPVGAIPAYTYEIAANLPVFTGGRIRAEIANAELDLRKLEQQRQATVDQIAFEVKTALAQLDSARNEVDVANLGVKLAQEEVVQARDRFQAGVANNVEVITAQDALARASDNQIAALYRYNQARADLARATGQMENLYAK